MGQTEPRACAHPIIETREEGVGFCMSCGARLGLVELNGQPVGYVQTPPP